VSDRKRETHSPRRSNARRHTWVQKAGQLSTGCARTYNPYVLSHLFYAARRHGHALLLHQHGPVHELEQGAVHELEQGPVHELEQGPVHELEQGPVHSQEPAPPTCSPLRGGVESASDRALLPDAQAGVRGSSRGKRRGVGKAEGRRDGGTGEGDEGEGNGETVVDPSRALGRGGEWAGEGEGMLRPMLRPIASTFGLSVDLGCFLSPSALRPGRAAGGARDVGAEEGLTFGEAGSVWRQEPAAVKTPCELVLVALPEV